MTTQETRALKTAVLVAGTLALLGMAWTSKADVSQVERLEHKVDALLSLQCRSVNKDDTICREYR